MRVRVATRVSGSVKFALNWPTSVRRRYAFAPRCTPRPSHGPDGRSRSAAWERSSPPPARLIVRRISRLRQRSSTTPGFSSQDAGTPPARRMRADQSRLVMRVGTGMVLLLAWQADRVLVPDLPVPAPWVGWLEFALAALIPAH